MRAVGAFFSVVGLDSWGDREAGGARGLGVGRPAALAVEARDGEGLERSHHECVFDVPKIICLISLAGGLEIGGESRGKRKSEKVSSLVFVTVPLDLDAAEPTRRPHEGS